jgi:hypothetical protein
MHSWHPRSAATSRRLFAAVGSAFAAVALLVPATAAGAAPSPSAPAGHIGGIVPVHGSVHATGGPAGGGNLSYHQGPVMPTNNVYVIYWAPAGYSVSSTYQSTVNKFFTDVAHDSALKTNVYAIDTQYYDTHGHIRNGSSFGSTQWVVDTDSLPSNGCSDSYTSVCLSDSQIQTEIRTVMSRQGWTTSSTNFFVMLTAKGIGSCSGSSCAFTQYCAYHGDASGLYYANMPYADTVPAACDSGQYPNGDPAADSEISILSHEHNETITDEQLNAWYDRRGSEIGDKCAWNFGTALGGVNGAKYNQIINGHDYYLQQEWSNQILGCALHM